MTSGLLLDLIFLAFRVTMAWRFVSVASKRRAAAIRQGKIIQLLATWDSVST